MIKKLTDKLIDTKLSEIDVHIGNRIYLRRMMLSMSEEALGEKLGVEAKQVIKYEKGINRVGARRLDQLSLALAVPVSFFFENMSKSIAPFDRDELSDHEFAPYVLDVS